MLDSSISFKCLFYDFFPLGHIYKLSRGEFCVANFIPPANGAGQGNYFLPKNHKLAVLEEKKGFQKQRWQPKLQTFLNSFWFWFDERSGNNWGQS